MGALTSSAYGAGLSTEIRDDTFECSECVGCLASVTDSFGYGELGVVYGDHSSGVYVNVTCDSSDYSGTDIAYSAGYLSGGGASS